MITLTHQVKDCIDAAELLEGVATIDEFCRRCERLANKCSLEDDRDKLKGDLLELFAEYFINTQPYHPRVRVKDYVPLDSYTPPADGSITISGDYGIDGVGNSTLNGKPVLVQVKYRNNPQADLNYTKDKLGNLIAQAVTTGLIWELDRDNLRSNLLYITTAKGIGELTMQKAFVNKVNCLGRDELADICDNQQEWWIDFHRSIVGSQQQPKTVVAKTLRKHQDEAVAAVVSDIESGIPKGQVILPTGTGKTLIMSRVILHFTHNDLPPQADRETADPILSISEVSERVEAAQREMKIDKLNKESTGQAL